MIKPIILTIFLITVLSNSSFARPLVKSAYVDGDLPLEEHLILNKIDNNTDLILSTHRISDDTSKFSLGYRFHPNVRGTLDVSTFEGIYSKKLGFCWLEFLFSRTIAKFKNVSEFNQSIGPSTAKLESSEDEIIIAGIGIGYRSTYVQKALENFLFSEDIFETTSAFLTYQSFNEKYYDNRFSGPGIQTDFGIHKRATNSFHYGIKFTYNLSTVKKSSSETNSTSSSRSLSLSWISFGIDFGFYL